MAAPKFQSLGDQFFIGCHPLDVGKASLGVTAEDGLQATWCAEEAVKTASMNPA